MANINVTGLLKYLDANHVIKEVTVPGKKGRFGKTAAPTYQVKELDLTSHDIDASLHPKSQALAPQITSAGVIKETGLDPHFEGGGVSSRDLLTKFERAGELEKQAAEHTGSEYLKKSLKERADTVRKEANSDVKKVFKQKSKALEMLERQSVELDKDSKDFFAKISKEHKVAVNSLKEQVKSGAISQEAHDAAAETLSRNLSEIERKAGETFTQQREKIAETKTKIVEHASKLESVSEHKMSNFASKNALSTGAKAAEKGIIGTAADFEKLDTFGKLKAKASANFKQSGGGRKFVRGLGTVAGVIAVGAGIKDMLRGAGILSPKTDEAGKEVPAGGGDLIKGVGEAGVGLGIVYASLVMGKNRAITH